MPVAVRFLLKLRLRRGVVDQHIAIPCGLGDSIRRQSVARVHDLATAAGCAENIVGPDCASTHHDGLPRLESAVERSLGNAEFVCFLEAEPPGSHRLLEHVSECGHRVRGLDRLHPVLSAVDDVSAPQPLCTHGEPGREVPNGDEGLHEVLRTLRAIDEQLPLPSVHGHRLDESRDPEEVIAVEMREKDAGHLHERKAGQHELTLRALAAVEQNHLRASLHGDRGHAPLRSRPGAARAEEYDLHGRDIGPTGINLFRDDWEAFVESINRGRGIATPGPAKMLAIDGESLTVEEVVRVARGEEPVRLTARATQRIDASREALVRIVKSGRPVYGVTTGFGQLENVSISSADLLRLQVNLVRSHAVGVGEPLSEDAVRASILVRANALAKGYSGVRKQLIELLLAMVNRGVHPIVPSQGSLGASGDLAPLAHIALVVIGEGSAMFRGRRMSGAAALRAARLKPLRLEAKEGLAILNGTAVMAGIGCLLVADALQLLKDAEISASMSVEALRGSAQPFDERLARLKKQAGQQLIAGAMTRLLKESEVAESHKGPHKVQDAYSLRCIPQVLGACYESIHYARHVVEIEINSATDNPVIFPCTGEVLSGGNFHGESLAMALDFLAVGLSVLGAISERRIARLVDSHLSGLPPFLTEHSGLQSGMMLLQYTAAALASENKLYAHPASTDSIPTSANQEDHNSMGQTSALKARRVLENVRRIIGVEYLCAAQGLEFLKPLRPGIGPRLAHRVIRRGIPRLTHDRPQAEDIERVVGMMTAGVLARAVEEKVGHLA